jgi:hypothetical protein
MSRRKYYDDYYDDDYYSWKIDTKQAKRDFMNYANKEKRIEQEGFEKMGKTLGIDIYTDIFITYFLYKCDTKNIEYLTEDQYIQGLTAFKCNTMQEVKNKIMDIKGELLLINEDDFQKFYYYLFDLNVSGSEKDKKTKSLSYDIVELYFKALFCNQFDKVTEFLEFLRFKNVGLKWDEWRTFLDFVRQKIDTFPKDYYVSDYYPTLIDDFYYWYCQKHNIPIPKEEEEY